MIAALVGVVCFCILVWITNATNVAKTLLMIKEKMSWLLNCMGMIWGSKKSEKMREKTATKVTCTRVSRL